MKYFTIAELCKSNTATAKSIDNTPTAEVESNLKELIENVLDPIRDRYAAPMLINCGYRCPKLNKAVGGVATSQHLKGEAADIANNSILQLKVLGMVKRNELDFDQLIIEKPDSKGIGAWLHISYRKCNNRKQVLIFKNGKYAPYNI